jgi:dihydropyrimidine dehydrogenase (NAD+) subunit PreA
MEMMMRAFNEGWGGAVTKTICMGGTKSPQPRLMGAKGAIRNFYLENIELISEYPAKKWEKWIREIARYYSQPVIASIMAGAKELGEWRELALKLENAGAKAVELNVSCPHGMPERFAGAFIGQDPDLTAEITAIVKEALQIPVWVKLTPNVTDILHIGKSALSAGADSLSAINTVSGLGGIDIETMNPLPNVRGFSALGGISGSAIKPIALKCVEQLSSLGKPVSGIGGISNWEDAVEFFLLGAGTVQICTAVMLRGYGIIGDMVSGLENYLARKGFSSVEEIIGLAKRSVLPFENLALDKGPIYKVGAKCDFCGDCIIACNDAGFQAIIPRQAKAFIIMRKCDRCGLCKLVCPVDAIEESG